MTEINMDTVVAKVKEAGFDAYVEQTGGGCATIFAGVKDADGRWTLAAGPGGFDGPAWTNARADTTEFYIGPDDDGENPPLATAEDDTEDTIAERMVALLRVLA